MCTATPVADRTCGACQQRVGVKVVLIHCKFHLGKGPPGLDPEKTLCPCCDRLWAESGNPAMPTKGVDGVGAGAATMRAAATVVTTGATMHMMTPQAPSHQQRIMHQPQPPPATISAMPPGSSGGGVGGGAMATPMSMQSFFPGTATPAATRSDVDTSSYDAALAGLAIRPTRTPYNPPAPRGPASSSAASFGGGSGSGSGIGDVPIGADPNAPLCDCQLPAKFCTVMKDGPNKGRPFYGCVKPRYVECGGRG